MKKWIIIVSVIVVLVLGFILYLLSNDGPFWHPGKCGGIGCIDDCSTLQDTTCKAQCDDTIELKIDGPHCETEKFVCCQLRLYPLK